MQKRTIVFQPFPTQPDDKGDAEGEGSKEESKYLGEESLAHGMTSHKLKFGFTCLSSDILSLILAGMKSLSAIAARALRPVLMVLPRTTCQPEKE